MNPNGKYDEIMGLAHHVSPAMTLSFGKPED